MIDKAMTVLANVQRQLNDMHDAEAVAWDPGARSDRSYYPDFHSRLFAADIGGVVAVEYYGEAYGDAWDAVQSALSSKEVAPCIALLRLTGPDQGANGQKEWDFRTLLRSNPQFPRLTHLHVEPTEPAHHNFAIIEDGQTPAVLATMPNLRRLVLPQAPEPDFFSLGLDRLQFLRIGMAHRTHGFIQHLSESRALHALTMLDFADSLGPWLSTDALPAEWTSTPFSHFEALLKSSAVSNLAVLFLRNTMLTKEQFQELQNLRSDLQLAAISATPLVYVSHWDTTEFPYRHVLPR